MHAVRHITQVKRANRSTLANMIGIDASTLTKDHQRITGNQETRPHHCALLCAPVERKRNCVGIELVPDGTAEPE